MRKKQRKKKQRKIKRFVKPEGKILNIYVLHFRQNVCGSIHISISSIDGICNLICLSSMRIQVYKDRLLSLEANQKLGLCHAHLSLGDWAGAQDLIKMLPHFLPVWSPPIAKVLCELVSKSIEPLYRRYISAH